MNSTSHKIQFELKQPKNHVTLNLVETLAKNFRKVLGNLHVHCQGEQIDYADYDSGEIFLLRGVKREKLSPQTEKFDFYQSS